MKAVVSMLRYWKVVRKPPVPLKGPSTTSWVRPTVGRFKGSRVIQELHVGSSNQKGALGEARDSAVRRRDLASAQRLCVVGPGAVGLGRRMREAIGKDLLRVCHAFRSFLSNMNSKHANRDVEVFKSSVKRVRFELFCPGAQHVLLAASFNDWEPCAAPMRFDGEGWWDVEVNLPPGRHEYLFVVDGQWMADPCAVESVPNPKGGWLSVASVPCEQSVRPDKADGPQISRATKRPAEPKPPQVFASASS